MRTIDPSLNTERENYKLLIGSIIPRPIAFVTSITEDGTLNGAPFSYFNIVTANPPMISLAIQRLDGRRKDTARNILKSKEFVVHIVDDLNVEKVNKTAANLASNQSEIEIAHLTPIKSTKISVPGIKEAKVRMECILEQSLELGGNDSPVCDFIIGRAIQFHIDDAIYENGRINQVGLGAVSRLAGNDYAKIGEVFTLERPK
ncbi:flavin reductase family protein [Neobacillus ginsengisoli]|uniref:Flavin reductase (DIM6/NTAB) family NADH-FMN oxidoreductase RutF n=1 Tax=Neobacillus ginsengisoli TaxID=904295 RepID=A0ABT9Y0M6_9BACI|nr:flavin reductase family protein [Neobacillus ginsengisoli]MDQ0201378.1 flavin reductase (DIM6/NTAB) family NADH-FMN oxidoreductase RutF [Neobacillus ginsengisoli]